MKAVVFALVLLGVAFATATSETEAIQLIHKIDATPFGRTLFDTIALQLEAGDPLERLLNTLHDLEDRYIAEQKEDDAVNYSFQQACNADIARFDQELAEANNEKIRFEAKLEGDLYPRRSIIQGLVNAKTAEVRGFQKEIDELDAERQEQNEAFEELVRDHNTAIAVLTEARNLIKENVETQSFVQKGQKVLSKQLSADTPSLLQKNLHEGSRRLAKTKNMQRYVPVIKLLIGISSKATSLVQEGHLDRVLELFDNLIHEVEESLDLERFAEDKRVQAYNKSRALLTRSLNVANSELANAQTELASVNDQIAQTETSLENTNQRIANLTERRQDRWDQCEEAARDYQEARAARDSDRQTVSDAIGLVNSSLRTLREQLALRQQAGEQIGY